MTGPYRVRFWVHLSPEQVDQVAVAVNHLVWLSARRRRRKGGSTQYLAFAATPVELDEGRVRLLHREQIALLPDCVEWNPLGQMPGLGSPEPISRKDFAQILKCRISGAWLCWQDQRWVISLHLYRQAKAPLQPSSTHKHTKSKVLLDFNRELREIKKINAKSHHTSSWGKIVEGSRGTKIISGGGIETNKKKH